METKDLILLVWRNIKYIILGLAVGLGIGILVSKVQTPVYEATTKVFVSRTRQQGNSDIMSLSDEQLLAINLQLAKSQTVLSEVSSQLGDSVDVDNIQAAAIPNTLIIQIKVQDKDPKHAAVIANLIVHTLVQQNETLFTGRYMGLENALNEQIDQVQLEIDGLQAQIDQINNTNAQEQLTQVSQQIEQLELEVSDLEKEIAGFPDYLTPLDRVSLSEKQARLDQLRSLMTFYQQVQTNLTYIGKPIQSGSALENPRLTTLHSTLTLFEQINTTLINSRENIKLARAQSKQSVVQIVSATPPKEPIRPMPLLYILLGGVVGLTLAVAFILTIDHMDDSLKSSSQIEELLGLPVLGFVTQNKQSKNELITTYDPFSAETKAFCTLGASLEVIGMGKKFHTLMIMNAEPADARTTIAANLAVVNARQGKNVILIDGDLRHPHLHSLFGMENQTGFAELLGDDNPDIKGACHAVNNIQGLTLIPSGIAKDELTAWLDPRKWDQLLLKLQKAADLVIVDDPPVDVADAQVLASKVDAVLLAISAGHTRIDSAQATLKKLKLIDAKVAGAVLNRIIKYRKINKLFLPKLKIRSSKKGKVGETASEIDRPVISTS